MAEILPRTSFAAVHLVFLGLKLAGVYSTRTTNLFQVEILLRLFTNHFDLLTAMEGL